MYICGIEIAKYLDKERTMPLTDFFESMARADHANQNIFTNAITLTLIGYMCILVYHSW